MSAADNTQCRLCGIETEEQKWLFDKANVELLSKFRATISILVNFAYSEFLCMTLCPFIICIA